MTSSPVTPKTQKTSKFLAVVDTSKKIIKIRETRGGRKKSKKKGKKERRKKEQKRNRNRTEQKIKKKKKERERKKEKSAHTEHHTVNGAGNSCNEFSSVSMTSTETQ